MELNQHQKVPATLKFYLKQTILEHLWMHLSASKCSMKLQKSTICA